MQKLLSEESKKLLQIKNVIIHNHPMCAPYHDSDGHSRNFAFKLAVANCDCQILDSTDATNCF